MASQDIAKAAASMLYSEAIKLTGGDLVIAGAALRLALEANALDRYDEARQIAFSEIKPSEITRHASALCGEGGKP